MAEPEYAEIFREETSELLEELESSLLDLEKAPEDLKLVGRVFRAMHTIKGSGSMFGFDEIAGFTHHVETVLDLVRNGKVPVTNELIDQVLAARDHIKNLLDASTVGGEAEQGRGNEIIAALKALAAGETASSGVTKEVSEKSSESAAAAGKTGEEVPLDKGGLAHYRIRFCPLAAFAESGLKEEDLFKELEKLGECSVFHTNKEQQPCSEQPKWDIILTTAEGLNAVKDVFIFVEHLAQISIKTLIEDVEQEDLLEHKRIGEILVERGDVMFEDVERVLAQQKPLGKMLVDAKLVSHAQIESAMAEQKTYQQNKFLAKSKGSIRVASEKLDKLINLVGELVVTQARLSQVSASIEQNEFLEPVEEVERLTAELRDCVLDVRMLPIGTTFGKFSRLVRDLSSELGKEIDLVTEGAETELDKTVIERLNDPLIHLIRNAIDHGIELPAERETIGKPRRGYVRLTAIHSGANVIISIQDDGRGLDPAKIRAKAEANGLLTPKEEISDQEVLGLIFAAGFSTAEKVTNVSGRGVGMDVVKSAIDNLNGSVEISSRKGEDTTITITLPLTLAIIDGLLVRAGDTHFVLPLNMVEECVELTSAEIARYHGRRVLPVREHLMPYVRLRDFFEIEGERPDREQMVVVQMDGDRAGVVLDEVIGGHQTVIKSLGWIYRQAEGLSGSTILGSGEVALIIDVPQLVQRAHREEAMSIRSRSAAVH
jgi:two-component system chemotaxis sensor kinase CheA